MRTLLLGFLFLIAALTVQAAPMPATSTSALTAPEKGLYFAQKGFILKTEGTDWLPQAPNKDSLIGAIRFAPADPASTGSLSVRTDKISAQVSLEVYAKKFMRDYPSYGFDVLGSKTISINQNPGLVVDMVQRTKNKQLRQVILKKNGKVAILTCIDNKDVFLKTIAGCNQIIKSFQWTADSAPESKELPKAKIQ